MMKQRKWLIRCGQNGNESRKGVGQCPFVIVVLSALEWASYLTFTLHAEHGKPESLPLGKLSVKMADSGAGTGGWRKPKLHCNDADTDLCLARK
ncbi:hypothetical protein AB4527_08190 [Vibrio breoganii]